MADKFKYKKEIEKHLTFDYFLVEKIRISREELESRNPKYFKFIEKLQTLSARGSGSRKPISKLVDPNDF